MRRSSSSFRGRFAFHSGRRRWSFRPWYFSPIETRSIAALACRSGSRHAASMPCPSGADLSKGSVRSHGIRAVLPKPGGCRLAVCGGRRETRTLKSDSREAEPGTLHPEPEDPAGARHACELGACPRSGSQMVVSRRGRRHARQDPGLPGRRSRSTLRSTNPILAGRSASRRMKYGYHSRPNGT